MADYREALALVTAIIATVTGFAIAKGRREVAEVSGASAEAVLKRSLDDNTNAIRDLTATNLEAVKANREQVQNFKDNNKLIHDVLSEVRSMNSNLTEIRIELKTQNRNR